MKKKGFIKKLLLFIVFVIAALVAVMFFMDGEDDYEDSTTNSFFDDDDELNNENYNNHITYDEIYSNNPPKSILTATDFQKSKEATVKDGTWTIMYYMCGSDLESENFYASDDLVEISNAATNPNIQIIVQTGGAKRWGLDNFSAKNIDRYQLSNGKYILKDRQPNASMGNSKTLSSFIKWTKENYPAERYMIIFWNHGSGSAFGVCFDELYKDENDNPDSLSVKEMAQGLHDGGLTFDIIGYDTCLTATIENNYAISPYGRYVVASEEVEPAEGWNYEDWITYLCKNPTCSTKDLCKKIIDSYISLCNENERGDSATLSCVDLGKISPVHDAFVKMASEMTGFISDVASFKSIKQQAKSARYFGTRTSTEGYSNMTDLGDLAKRLSPDLSDSSNALLNAINNAVVYEKHGPDRARATGISVFYPVNAEERELNSMADGTLNGPYLAFIDAICENWKAPDWVYATAVPDNKPAQNNKYDKENNSEPVKRFIPARSKDYSVKFKDFIDTDDYYTLKITSGLEIIDCIEFDLCYLLDDDNILVLGTDDNITADWDRGIFKDNFDGTWISMDGSYMSIYLLEQGENYNIYTSPIILNGEDTNLRIKYDFDKQSYSIIGAFDSTESWGAASRKMRTLKEGDQITFLFEVYSTDDDEAELYETDTITYSSKTKITDDELFDGDYFYSFTIYDIFDKEYYTDGVNMTVADGEIILN